MVKKIKYDWKKTARKIIIQLTLILIAGLAVVYGKSPWFAMVAPLLIGLENILKHKYKIKLV